MRITSAMKQLHNKNRTAKRLKAVLSLVLAVSLMLSTLCILVLNAAAEVLPIENDLIDGISMKLFNYGNGINRYMRNIDASVGRMGDYYYNNFGNVVNTYGGGFLPFVDQENAGSGPSVDHIGMEAALQHSYPNMSMVLDADGMPVVNEQPTSVLYQPNQLLSNFYDNSRVTNGGLTGMKYDQGNEFSAIKWTQGSSGNNAKSGIAIRTPGLDNTYSLYADRSKITFTGWFYVDADNVNTGEEIASNSQFFLSLIPDGCWVAKDSDAGYNSTAKHDNSAEFWAFRQNIKNYIKDANGNSTTMKDGWNYFVLPVTSMDIANDDKDRPKFAFDKYNSDPDKQIAALLLYYNDRGTLTPYKTTMLADVRVTHSEKGTLNLMDDDYFQYTSSPKFSSPVEESGRIGTVVKETVVIEPAQNKDMYYCDVVDRYRTTSSKWYTAESNPSFTAAVASNRKRGMTISTDVQIPYFMDYKSKYSLELDIYFDDTYFHDGNALTQNMIVSILADGYDDATSTNNAAHKNLTEDYAIRYLLYNEGNLNEAPTIKAGWNHLSIPLTAKNWVHSESNTAPYDALVSTGKIGGISFHENNENYVGTYDFGVGNVSIKKNNGVGIYPTYYNLVTVNNILSNASSKPSVITVAKDGLKSQASGKTNAIVIDDAAYSVNDTNTEVGSHRKQGIMVTTFNDETDYRYIKNFGKVTEHFISVWLYLEPKNNDWASTPDTNIEVCLVAENEVSLKNYYEESDSDFALGVAKPGSTHAAWSEHLFYRKAIDNAKVEWGWNHIMIGLDNAKDFQALKNASDQWNVELYNSITNFNNNGRIDGVGVYEMTAGGAATYNMALGGISIVNFNDSGSLGYLFDDSKATISKAEYLTGMANRLNASGDADAYEGDGWHNRYDDAVFNYQSAYFPVDNTTSGLFQYDRTTGTYYYKSNHNAATYNMQTNRFDLYDYTINRYNKGYEIYTEGEDAGYPLDNYANFYPFNTGHTQGALNYNNQTKTDTWYSELGQVGNTYVLDGFNANKPAGAILDNYSLYQNSKENEIDLSYGFTFEFDFNMPKKGITTAGNEMVFSFTGDDDIWVYIDGILFLDIGGAHPPRTGSINFATGVIKYQNLNNTSNSANADLSVFEYTSIREQLLKAKAELEAAGLTAGDQYTKITNLLNELVAVSYVDDNGVTQTGYTFKDYSMHELNFFYLERGGTDSCCKIEFNLEPLPEQSLSVTKTLEDVNPGLAGELYFTFTLTDENGAPITQWPYELCYKGTSNSLDGIQRYTGDDGTFVVAGETTALFKDIPVNTVFNIRETAFSQDTFELRSNSYSGAYLDTGPISMPDTPMVVEFINYPTVPLYNKFLEITKYVNGYDPIPDRVYDIILEFDLDRDDQYIAYTGPATKTDANGNESRINIRDGLIKLKADEKVYIDGLCPDLKYRVKELAPTQQVEGYEFVDPVINKVTCPFGEYAEFIIVDIGDANNEIGVYNTIRETYGDIRITKDGVDKLDHHEDETPENTEDLGKQELQTTIFNIKGTESTNEEIDFDVAIIGNDSVVIRDLPVGVYDVTEKTDWSWRYSPDNAIKQIEVKAAGSLSSEKIIEAKTNNNPVEYGSTLADDYTGDGVADPKGEVSYEVIGGQTAYSYVFNANAQTNTRKDGMYISAGDKKMELVGYEENYTVKLEVYISNITDYELIFQFIPTGYLVESLNNYTEFWAYRYTFSNETLDFATKLQQGWNTVEIPLSEFKSGLNENGTHTGPAFNALAHDGSIGYVTVHENDIDGYATEYTFAIKSVEIVSNMPEAKFTNSREKIYYLSGDNVAVNTFSND